MSDRVCRPNMDVINRLVGPGCRGRGARFRRKLLFSQAKEMAAKKLFADAQQEELVVSDFEDAPEVVQVVAEPKPAVVSSEEPDPLLPPMPTIRQHDPEFAAKMDELARDLAEHGRAIRAQKDALSEESKCIDRFQAKIEGVHARLDNFENKLDELQESVRKLTDLTVLTTNSVVRLLKAQLNI